MTDQPAQSQFAQLQDVARRLLALDVADDDLRSKVVALKGRATRALNTPVGNPNIKDARAKAIKSRQTAASAFNASIAPHIRAAKTAGKSSLSEIAQYLNDNNLKTRRGSRWLPVSVSRVLQELQTNH